MSADNMHPGSKAVQAFVAPSASEAAVMDRLAELSRLPINWDSYGGVPPTETAVNVAYQFVTTAAWLSGDGSRLDEPAEISPVPDGGLLLAWSSDTHEVQLRVRLDGALDVLLVDLTRAEPRYEEHHDVSRQQAVTHIVGTLRGAQTR